MREQRDRNNTWRRRRDEREQKVSTGPRSPCCSRTVTNEYQDTFYLVARSHQRPTSIRIDGPSRVCEEDALGRNAHSPADEFGVARSRPGRCLQHFHGVFCKCFPFFRTQGFPARTPEPDLRFPQFFACPTNLCWAFQVQFTISGSPSIPACNLLFAQRLYSCFKRSKPSL